MGWEDRPYYRDRPGGPTNPLMWLLAGSVPLGTWFGIRVRMHVSMIIVIVFTLLFAEAPGGMGARNALTSMTILFFSVLLHEFGHCFGARYMGGEANEILMWPLGGLAYTAPPRRPWPSLVTTAAGPAVNLLICIATATAIALINRSIYAVPWFPFQRELREYIRPEWPLTTYYLWWIFLVNYALLAFNLLLVFYPFDGGRIVQELLWFKIGYYKSMRFATVVGMVGACFAAAFGLATRSLLLIFIAVFGFITCYRQRQMLREMGPGDFDDPIDYTASIYGTSGGGWSGGGGSTATSARRETRAAKKAADRARRLAAEEAAEQAKIDQILAKVSANGMNSLSWAEKRALRKATERQRQRDAELGRVRRG